LYNKKITERQYQDYIWKISGPHLLSEVYLNHKKNVFILPKEQYNPNIKAYNKDLKTKHMETGIWGKDALEHIKSLNLSFEETYKLDISKFDFYKNYNLISYQ
jgi:hypothetical protein